MAYDNNRSKDVPGPLLKRPFDMEIEKMEDKGSDKGIISQFSLADLHMGNVEKPLSASGKQEVVVSMPMGSKQAVSAPKIKK